MLCLTPSSPSPQDVDAMYKRKSLDPAQLDLNKLTGEENVMHVSVCILLCMHCHGYSCHA